MLSHFIDNEKTGKEELRAKMLAMRKCHAATAKAACNMLASEIWQNVASAALYVPLQGEADTWPLLENAWAAGKYACLPRILSPGVMAFYPCANAEELEKGLFGLLEPPMGQAASHVELMILPGVAFDRAGNRLGFGGGYYDRFLQLNPDFATLRAGLCHDYQIVNSLPHGQQDIPVQCLCGESGLIWF